MNAGSFILFRRDLSNNLQVKTLTDDLHAIALASSSAPALITVDQEGGQVSRVPFSPPLPSARALGATDNPDLIRKVGQQTAIMLRQLGINGNLAPVLDLGSSSTSFIGSRAYSGDAERVSSLGNAFAQGLSEGKVLPVAKHFPGIGPVQNDPHLTIVRRSTPASELLAKDFLPFRKFSSIYPSGLMISHLVYPALDIRGLPGTFSKEIQQKYARETIGYQGLLMTDDLLMIKTRTPTEFKKNIQNAFIAGADLIMISWSSEKQRTAVEAILDGVRTKLFTEKDVRDRAARILEVRKLIGRPAFQAPSDRTQLRLARNSDYERLVEQALSSSLRTQLANFSARGSITLVRAPQSFRLWTERHGSQQLRKALSFSNGCKKDGPCFYFAFHKKDVVSIEKELSKMSRARRKSVAIFYFRDVVPAQSPHLELHVQILSPHWAQSIGDELAHLIKKNQVAANAEL
jgi:beta-N-acetylhexosaminidase